MDVYVYEEERVGVLDSMPTHMLSALCGHKCGDFGAHFYGVLMTTHAIFFRQ